MREGRGGEGRGGEEGGKTNKREGEEREGEEREGREGRAGVKYRGRGGHKIYTSTCTYEVYTLACLWRKDANSVFHVPASALREFFTGSVASWSGPT